MRLSRFYYVYALSIILSVAALACAQPSDSEGKYLLVLNKAGNTLSILNPDGFKILGTVPVGNGPHEVVVSADGSTAFVTNYGDRSGPGNSLSIIDIKAMKETKRVDLGALYRPHGIQVIGGKVYFSAESNRAIARYDPKADKVDWIIRGQTASHMVVGTNDEKFFYTANIGSNTVTMIALTGVPPAGTSVFQIPVGNQPEAIHLSPDGKEVWVGLNQDNGIDVIDTASKKVIKRIDLGERPYRVVFEPSGKRVFTTIFATNEVVEIDAATKKIMRRLKLENRAFGITFTKDGKFAFVTTIQQDGFVKIDLEKLEVVGKGTAGAGPDGIAVTF